MIRLFAAFQVVLFHVCDRLQISIPDLMWLRNFKGVLIFFTISGFLVTSSLLRNNSIKRYCINRFLRIYPALYGLTTLTILAMLFTHDITFSSFGDKNFIWWVFSWITINQNYTPDCLSGFGIGTPNGSLWTIPIEIAFYVILPFVLLPFFRKRKRMEVAVLFFLIMISVFSNHYWHDFWATNKWKNIFSYSVIPYLYAFLFGGLISLFWDKFKPYFVNKLLYYLLPFLLLIIIDIYYPQCGMHTSMTIHTIRELFMNFLLSATTIAAAYSFVNINKILRGNDISYGVYLFHGLVINLIIEITNYRGVILYPIVYAASIVLSYFSWKFIESPALALKAHIKQ